MSVRNLRAMFENKTQESPPDRGRSPGVSSSANESASGTESPRPLSKVRTSFVAIEKDGRIGLQQRNPSEASSMSGRKLSEDTEAASSVQLDNTSTVASEATTSQSEPPKEVASLIPSGPPKGLAESPQIKEDPRARKSDYGSHARKSQEAVDQAPAAPAAPVAAPTGNQENKTNGVKAVETPAKSTPAKSTPAASATPAEPAGDHVKKANGVKAVETPAKSTPARPTPAASAKPAPSAKPAEEPAATEPAGTRRQAGASVPAVSAVSAAPSKKVTDKEIVKSPDSVAQPKPATKPANTTSHPPTTPKAAKPSTEKKAAPASASPGGFVKPRPKSPTRPVKLPPSLTTHTTASGSRTRVPSGSAPPSSHENSARSASRAKALGRSSSAAGRQRPSIGPPPKLPAKDHPVVKKDAKVDEGFLARMMRPTQASASKKNEKVPITPPRRPAAAAPKKSASAKSLPTKRPVSKTTSATTSAAPSPERTKKESSADRDIATVIEKMSIAENVQETPKTPEREATITEELEEEKSGAAPEAPNKPEVEEAVAPLANGNHKEETEGPTSAGVTESKGKTEQAASQVTDTGALPDEETW